MTDRFLVLRADDIEPFVYPGQDAYLSQHVLGRENTGLHDLFLNRGTVRPFKSLGGEAHAHNDEIYYIVGGRGLLDLGGDSQNGSGGETFSIEAGMVIYIPAGTFHRLRNTSDEDLTILTIWPEPVSAQEHGIQRERVKAWGTGFRLREGRELVTTEGGAQVAEPGSGWSPLVQQADGNP
jgi:mannose-6-phosphate isomerase-like protein (cupin superfamily)